ncbi:MAG: amidohydrolase family protein [Woeseiaceae bacterium]|nr:amidohydrolase family protein [Woeseiaceae bacterium]
MDDGWLEFDPNPSKPSFALPPGAVDAHCHVFGPGATFPYAATRKYTPCDAPKETLWALRDHLGFTRNVIVQATCHGTDNRALLDALENSNGLARGVATVSNDMSDEQLQALHDAGVRGARFNFVRRLVDVLPHNELLAIGERIQSMGWHLVIYIESQDLATLRCFLEGLPGTIVFDHMGRPDVSRDIYDNAFELFVQMLTENENMWTKVSCPDRLTLAGPPGYDDVVPFARHLVETFPDRVLWGTDWPHPNLKSHMPDDGKLVDYVLAIAVNERLQQQLLIDNPMRLYWPEEAT